MAIEEGMITKVDVYTKDQLIAAMELYYIEFYNAPETFDDYGAKTPQENAVATIEYLLTKVEL